MPLTFDPGGLSSVLSSALCPGPRVANPWAQHLCCHSQPYSRTPPGPSQRGEERPHGGVPLPPRPIARGQPFALLANFSNTVSEFTPFLQKMWPVLGRGATFIPSRGACHVSLNGSSVTGGSPRVRESPSEPFKGVHACSLGGSLGRFSGPSLFSCS